MKPRFHFLMNEATDAGHGGGAAMNAGQLAGFSNGGEASAVPAAGAAPTNGGAAEAPADFASFVASLGNQEASQAEPANAEASGAASNDTAPQAAQAGGFNFEQWFAEKFPENPDPSKIAKVEDWKGMRTTLNTTMKDVQALSAEKMLLEQKLATALKARPGVAKGLALPESDAVKKLQGELEANRLEMENQRQKHDGELAEYRSFKAAQDLSANPAFRAEFDGSRAVIKEEIAGIVKEAGLSETVVESVLSAKSLLQIAKALQGVDDPAARALIQDRAAKFAEITAKREAALRGNPFEELTKWTEYAQTQQGMLASQFTDALKQQLVSAVPAVAGELAGDKGNIYFKTPAGQAALQQIGHRFEKGYDLTAQEVTTHMAKSAGFDFYATMAQDLMSKLADAEAKLARYADMDPAQEGRTGGGAGGKVAGFDVGSMFAGMRV